MVPASNGDFEYWLREDWKAFKAECRRLRGENDLDMVEIIRISNATGGTFADVRDALTEEDDE